MPPIDPTLRSLRHYALSGLGIVSLLLSAIIAIISSIFGGGSDPIDPKANVVFTVVDQYGHGRRCLKLIQPLEKPIYTSRWKIRKNMLSNLSFVISGN